MEIARDSHPEILRPSRFGAGQYMTIAYVEMDNLFGTGLVDIDSVVEKLKGYQELIDTCCES